MISSVNATDGSSKLETRNLPFAFSFMELIGDRDRGVVVMQLASKC